MANFEKSAEKLGIFEGGYSNDKNDAGGETNHGISKRSYPELDIKNLTKDDAKKIFKRDFWNPLNLDFWPECNLAYNVFEFSIHSGNHRAVIMLQICVNAINAHKILQEDGVFGSKTKEAFMQCDREVLNKCYKSATGFFYYHLTTIREEDKKFIKGWLKRAYED